MCNMFSILCAIFALFLTFAQAKHQFLRLYPFASADCNGPPIIGNVDVPRDVCRFIPFAAASIKLVEIELGDWTREINRGATGCYFYGYTQHGCYERYLDIIVDPGDVIGMCVPSRDANDPLMAVSFTCIYGEPPRRRRELPAENKTSNALNMSSPHVVDAYRRGRVVVDEILKSNTTRRYNHTIASGETDTDLNVTSITINLGDNKSNGPIQNVSARSVNNHGPAFIGGERNVNLTHNANLTRNTKSSGSDSPIEPRFLNFHGPAYINEKPNFNSSHKLSKRESDDESSVVSGTLNSNSTHKFNSSESESPVGPISARFVKLHGPASIDEEPSFNSSSESSSSESCEHVQLGNHTAGLPYVNGAPFTNRTNGQVFSVGTPTVADSEKDSDDSDDSDDDDSDDDSDWSDDDDDGSGDEYELSGNSTSFGNSTSLRKRNPWWAGPRRGVWMLHPWTGGLLCYDCYSKNKNQLTRFECRWGWKSRADCGEKPLAPVYTKTVTIQPVVTVTPLPKQHSLQKRSWHMPVYLQNPWYPGITVCSIAEWEGKGKREKQEIRIEQMHKKLKKCDKSPIAQNIAVFIRTATSTAPVKTVSIIDDSYNDPIVFPPPVEVVSTEDGDFKATIKTTVTTFEPIPLPTTSVASSESTASSAGLSMTTVVVAAPFSNSSVAASAPPASFSMEVVSVGPLPASLPMGTYVEPVAFSTVVVSRSDELTARSPLPTAQPAMPTIDLSPYAGVFTSVVVAHGGDEPEPEPTAQAELQNMYVDPMDGGFSTVITHRVSDTP